ncbi:MAG: helix-turn-helix domain-containing protein [Pseudomonadota bacterium]
MQELDLIVRISAATLFVGLALGWLCAGKTRRLSWYFFVFTLGLVGFLAHNSFDPELRIGGSAGTVFDILSGTVALYLWLFGSALFDDEFRIGPVEGAVSAVWITLALSDRGYLHPRFSDLGLSWLLIMIGFGMVIHLIYRIARDWRGDLIAGRRRLRSVVATGLVLLLFVDLTIDIVFGLHWKPGGLTILQNLAILLGGTGFAAHVLRFDSSRLGVSDQSAVSPPADKRHAELLARTERLMTEEKAYLDPDITFAQFAAKAGATEASVRAIINTHLGYGHFRAFLNAYRLQHAKNRLADVAFADEKIMTIALDSGFASIASFNRAFDAAEGQSPSQFRARQLSGQFGASANTVKSEA